MQWSKYQEAVFEDAKAGNGHTVVLARAGSGKTATIIESLRHLPKRNHRTLVVAFNRAIREEMESRAPRGPNIKTLHAFGRGILWKAWGNSAELDQRKVFRLMKEHLPWYYDVAWDVKRSLADAVSKAKGLLVEEPQELDNLIDAFDLYYGDGDRERKQFIQGILLMLKVCLEDQKTYDFDDMIWMPVKLRMQTPKYKHVFVDETQDLNRAQVELALRACGRGGRICAVGDDRQCHPPGVRVQIDHTGAEVPIELLAPESNTGATIAGWSRNAQRMVGGRHYRIAQRPYSGALRTVGVAGRDVPMTPNHKLLCRWSDRTVKTCVTYLMWREGYGFRVGWCQLFTTSSNARIFHLAHRARMEQADKTWILRTHNDRTEASLYESVVAARYGLPTMTFEPVHGANHITEDTIRRLFDAVADSNTGRGLAALSDHNRELALPLYPWPDMPDVRAKQGRATYFKVFASNVEPGLMSLPLPDGQNRWEPVDRVEVSSYEGPVFSLDVEEDHSYAANGVVVLNSIYLFRGADSHSIPRIIQRLNAKVLPLPITYRCDAAIVREAQRIVPDLEVEPGRPEGLVKKCAVEDLFRDARPGDFVLSRTNAPLIRLCLKLLLDKRPAGILGRRFSAVLLKLIERSKARTLGELQTWLQDWYDKETERLESKEPPGDTGLLDDKRRCMLALMEGASSIRELEQRIDQFFCDDDDARSRVTLSTTHKAKGLERDRVFVLRDTYLQWWCGKPPADEEHNLLYVAITRAKHELYFARGDVSSL